MKLFYEIVIISIIFFIICFIYRGQPRTTLNAGKGIDGSYYYSIAEQIQKGEKPVVGELPFVRRLGTPFFVARLSAITGMDMLDSALYINLAGALITVWLLLIWLRKFLEEFVIRGLLCLLYMTAWFAPLRFSFYIPLATDSWAAVWFLGSLLFLAGMRETFFAKQKKVLFIVNATAFSFFVATGNVFRESNAVLCILPFFILNPFQKPPVNSAVTTMSFAASYLKKTAKLYLTWRSVFLVLPLLTTILSALLIRKYILVSDQNLYSYVDNIFLCFYTKTLPEYILGILIAFGPMVLLLPLLFHQLNKLLLANQELLVLLIISLIFGFIGGTDTERILFMSGFPVFLLLIGVSIKTVYDSPQRWWLLILMILQCIAYRAFWILPDYTVKSGHTPFPFFGLMSNRFKYLYLYSHFSNYLLNTLLLLEYFLLYVTTWYIIRNNVTLKPRGGR